MLLPLAAWTGLRRMPAGRAAAVLGGGVALVGAVNVVGFYLLASATPQALREVRSLQDLVGDSPLSPVPKAEGPPRGRVQAVALGDSTAAGTGNGPLPDPDELDTACRRSADSYPRALARANGWRSLNLAGAGATVRDGILGVQILGDQVAPPQFAQAQRATQASVITLSTGANDVRWADLVKLCAASPSCDDRASTAFFRNRLTRFTLDYRNLLRQLAALPQHPRVLVNEYYDPFGTDVGCLCEEGLSPPKVSVLRSRLAALNSVLRHGAETAGFTSVRPDFTGHGLCSPQPYVQSPTDRAPCIRRRPGPWPSPSPTSGPSRPHPMISLARRRLRHGGTAVPGAAARRPGRRTPGRPARQRQRAEIHFRAAHHAPLRGP
ncbi:SGNH/GDSL hydrolase family protein [Streptomyces nigra]|uniref:SGNH/GDSL hydrolase family protein n=1 Tax=Streptomyces nigra TaxID=1827580 RepID=UPI0036BD901B